MHTHSDSISTHQTLGHTSPHEQGKFPSLSPFFEQVDPSSPPETKTNCHISVFSKMVQDQNGWRKYTTCNWITSARDAFLLETYWTQSSPSSVHSLSSIVICTMKNIASSCVLYIYLGGKIEWRISSVGVLVCFSSNLSVFAPPLAAIEVETSVGSSYKTKDAIEGIMILEPASSS